MPTALLTFCAISVSLTAAALQTGGTASEKRVGACALVPRALLEKVTPPADKRVPDLRPREEAIGPTGSSCSFATTMIQVDPFARADDMRRDSPGKGWERLTGVGDAAYFHNNSNQYAELIVWTGAHHFTIQLSVPAGSTAEASKPNLIEVANTLIPNMR
jgi:hypothetical protein